MLQLNIKQSYSSYTNFVFYDNTGEYSSSNLGGWGSPNFSISDIQWAKIRILKNNVVVKEYDLIDTFENAVTINDLRFILPYDSTDTIIPDGVYQIQYKVSTSSSTTWDTMNNNNSVIYIGYFAMWFVIQSMVFKRIALVPEHTKFKAVWDKFTEETSTIFMLLNSLIASAQYSDFITFESILDNLSQILSFDITWQIRKQ